MSKTNKSSEKFRAVPWERRWTVEKWDGKKWRQVYVGPKGTALSELKLLEKAGAQVEYPKESN